MKFLASVLAAASLAGCSAYAPFLPSSGPNADAVVEAPQTQPDSGILVVDVTSELARRAVLSQRSAGLSSLPGGTEAPRLTIGPGDSIEVSVWEAPPAALFGTALPDARGLSTSTSRVAVVPEQVVNAGGTVNVPFVGAVRAAGRMPSEVEEEITRRLRGKANDPQVSIRTVRTLSSSVTIVGEVANSTRLPLSPRGERLLDALASAGGVRQPVGKITIQVTREASEQGRRVARSAAVPLETIISDPEQNILLQPGDIVTVLHQPNSFTVLGAVTRNEEITFEAQGITLAQALGRSGGLRDERANARGVFIFRYEDPKLLGDLPARPTTPDGKVPVVYRVDLKDPASFFIAQGFPVRNRDVLYVSNAPAAELQKFLNLVSSVSIPFLQFRALSD